MFEKKIFPLTSAWLGFVLTWMCRFLFCEKQADKQWHFRWQYILATPLAFLFVGAGLYYGGEYMLSFLKTQYPQKYGSVLAKLPEMFEIAQKYGRWVLTLPGLCLLIDLVILLKKYFGNGLICVGAAMANIIGNIVWPDAMMVFRDLIESVLKAGTGWALIAFWTLMMIDGGCGVYKVYTIYTKHIGKAVETKKA